jgi:glucosamine kinase
LSYLLGVDGGGTKTKALIADHKGRIIGQGNSGPANILFDEPDAVRASIIEAIEVALAQAGIRGEEVRRGVFGVPATENLLFGSLKELLPNSEFFFLGEAPIAFASGSNKSFGVLLIAGTGSFSWGRNLRGDVTTTGGGGAAFGDEGSGFDLGREALRVIGKMYDGRGPETVIARKVCTLLNCNTFDEILSYVYGRQDTRSYRSRIAALAPVVLEAAGEEDPLACKIVEDAAAELELMVSTCARKLELLDEQIDVVLTGGVLRGGGPLLEALLGRLASSMPHAQPIVPKLEPAAGAIALAAREEDFSGWYQYIFKIK